MSTPTTPADLLRHLVAADPGRPRITVYDDTDSPTRGERVELSARVLANWVAKAANLLQDDLDVGPGSTVRIDLPPHWRTLYWALAAWSVGACVEVPAGRTGAGVDGRGAVGVAPAGGVLAAGGGSDAVPSPRASSGADVVVTDAVDAAAVADEAVLVTLAALARAAAVPVPAGVVDEARELATHGDVFEAWAEPGPADAALRVVGGGAGKDEASFAGLVPGGPASVGSERVHTSTPDTVAFLRLALQVWAGSGSLVLTRGEPAAEVLASRLEAEGVTRAV
ncbi:TIGR03089 family protein [Fodinibacter luteus]|uniref:TIGR03089 family protein n=1 Tax=Fodinibacter luteus TaxID=552064 RepID=A0ABP8JZJ5_9MICO